jgi:hypothetical protein
MLRVFPWNIHTVLLSVEIIFEVPDGVHLAEAGFQRGSYVTEGHFSPLCNQCRAQLPSVLCLNSTLSTKQWSSYFACDPRIGGTADLEMTWPCSAANPHLFDSRSIFFDVYQDIITSVHHNRTSPHERQLYPLPVRSNCPRRDIRCVSATDFRHPQPDLVDTGRSYPPCSTLRTLSFVHCGNFRLRLFEKLTSILRTCFCARVVKTQVRPDHCENGYSQLVLCRRLTVGLQSGKRFAAVEHKHQNATGLSA